MTISEELRAIADSIHLMLPFQAARLHVLAGQVDTLDTANALRRAAVSTVTTTIPPTTTTGTATVGS